MKFAVFTDPHVGSLKNKLELFREFVLRLEPLVDGFICPGDWSSLNFRDLEKAFKVIRSITDKPVLTVMGNHDFWADGEINEVSLDDVMQYHRDICKQYNITYLEEESFETEKSLIVGYTGWYNFFPSATKDYDFIPHMNSYGAPSFQVLNKHVLDKFYSCLDKAIASTKEQKVCVTHFSFTKDPAFEMKAGNYRHLEAIKENFQVLISGHSHQKYDIVEDGLRMINPGADYHFYEDYFYIVEL